MSTNGTAQVRPTVAQQSDGQYLVDGKPLREIVAEALFTAARGCSQPTVRRRARLQAISLMNA